MDKYSNGVFCTDTRFEFIGKHAQFKSCTDAQVALLHAQFDTQFEWRVLNLDIVIWVFLFTQNE